MDKFWIYLEPIAKRAKTTEKVTKKKKKRMGGNKIKSNGCMYDIIFFWCNTFSANDQTQIFQKLLPD